MAAALTVISSMATRKLLGEFGLTAAHIAVNASF